MSELTNFKDMGFDTFQSTMVNNMISNMQNILDDACIEGLKRKGYVFDNRRDLELFVVSNVVCNIYPNNGKRLYLVNNIPFLEYFPNMEVDWPILNENRETKINAKLGTINFL